jgi:membrane protein
MITTASVRTGITEAGSEAGPFLRRLLRDWFRHRCISKGASLAFYALFSLAPMLVLVIAAAGAIYGAEAATGEIVREMRGLIGPDGAAAIADLIKGARDPATSITASIVAGVLLVISSTTAFAELKESLDEIWCDRLVPDQGVLNVVRDRVLSFGLVMVLGFLLMVSLAVNAALGLMAERWVHSAGGGAVVVGLSSLVTFLVIAGLFAAIYKLLPPVRLSWSDVAIGAGITAALFAIGKYLIGLYLGNAALTSSLGAAGSLGVLALWVYYSSQIFFLGAEFTRLYAQQRGTLRGAPKKVKLKKEGAR